MSLKTVMLLALSFGMACPVLLYIILGLFEAPDLMRGSYGALALDNKGGTLKISLSADQKYRLPVSLDAIAPEARRAVLFYEDRHFYAHPGINVFSTLRSAFLYFLGPGRAPGASTITMQVARMRFGLKTSNISGKIKQMWLALLLERHYSKPEILEAYFNLAPYGGNIEGIEAASRIYFNKGADRLTVLESRALAVIPQNPGARNPITGKDFDKARKLLEARLSGNVQVPRLNARSPAKLPFVAPHVCMEVLKRAEGYKIQTGIETDLQKLLESSILHLVQRGRPYGINNAVAILVDCDTMLISALAGSAGFFNNGISGQIDGTRARRSPGSTLKPFIYALALDQGLIHPMTMLADSPRSFGGYDPQNFDMGFRGPLPAHEALKASRNLPAISLAEKLDQPGLYGFLQNAGITLPHDSDYYGLALTLGGAEISMRDLAGLYAMLANQGLWRAPRLCITGGTPAPRRLLSPEAAWLALWMLEREDAASRLPLRYKTGTSNGLRDAWTAGIVGKYALVVWVGNFDNQANPCFVGAQTALPLYLDIAEALTARRNLRDRHPDLLEKLNLEKIKVCAATGDPYKGQCEVTGETWIIPGISPTRDSGVLRPVLIDNVTGLRACQPRSGETHEVWYEFWPSDMLRIFASAGISKPAPPDWMPECAGASRMGKPPEIVMPKKNVAYQRALSERAVTLPLLASADKDAGRIHWYADSAYIGSSLPGEVLFYDLTRTGEVNIQAVDERGRAAKRKCLVQALP